MAKRSTTEQVAPPADAAPAPERQAAPSPPPQAEQQVPSPLNALLSDLRILDGRLHRAVERVRATITGDTDPGNRGLLIEESDVEGWLTNLNNVGASSHNGQGEGVASAQYVGQRGGRLYALSYLFGLGAF